jgi:hypothetical protein
VGFFDSIGQELAPFNIGVTIVARCHEFRVAVHNG